MRWPWKVLIGLAVLSLASGSVLADRRVALVIGNSSYQNVSKLPNPVKDAEAIANLLTSAGFDNVRVYRDLGISDLRRAIREFSRLALDADMAVVFYAGHGIELNGINYLIPIDAKLEQDIDAEDEAVSLDRVLSVVDPAKRLRLVILDACRENPFLRTMKRSMATRAISRGLAQVEPVTSDTLIAFAAKAGSVAADGAGPNSPFTTALLKHIAQPGLDLRIAFGRVRDDVLKSTSRMQEPFVYGSLGGTTVALVPAPEPKAAVPIPPPDPELAIRRDYDLAEKIGTKEVWRAFLERYPTGFYADLARGQLAKVLALETAGERAERQRAEDEARRQREEQAERERQQKERIAREQAERERQERERIAREQAERERAGKERIARERAEREWAEKERIAREQAARERAEKERIALEQAERERVEKEARKPAEQEKTSGETMKVTALAPPTKPVPAAPPAPPPSRNSLVEQIKKELKRVGCYAGPIDDEWATTQTNASVKKFLASAHASAAPAEPTVDFLDSLRGKPGRVCPLECKAREVEHDGRCITRTCPRGATLDEDGNCEMPSRRRNAAHPPERKGSAPTSYDPHDRSRQVTPGGQVTCGGRGCQKVPKGCYAVRGAGGHGMGGKIFCG